MSQGALCKAVRDQLQELFGMDADSCEVRPSGRPKASAGETFIAVHPGGWRLVVDGDVGLVEEFGCKVTVSRRFGYTPDDRTGTELWLGDDAEYEGIEPMLRQILIALTSKLATGTDTPPAYLVLIAANAYIGLQNPPTYAGGFITPLKLLDGGTPEEKGPEWFCASRSEGEDGAQFECGISQTMTFTGAQRGQVWSEAT